MRRKHPNTGTPRNPWLTSSAYHRWRKIQRREGFAPLNTRGIIRSQGDRPRTDVGWAERRQFRRKAVIWAAKLETDHGVFDCITLDLSLGGARLRCAGRSRCSSRRPWCWINSAGSRPRWCGPPRPRSACNSPNRPSRSPTASATSCRSGLSPHPLLFSHLASASSADRRRGIRPRAGRARGARYSCPAPARPS